MASRSLDDVLPARAQLVDVLTGEVIDRDDVVAIASALAGIEQFLDELYGKHRRVYRARDELKARLGELKVTDLPARRNQTDKQAKIERCPRCRTRLPRVVIVDASEES